MAPAKKQIIFAFYPGRSKLFVFARGSLPDRHRREINSERYKCARNHITYIRNDEWNRSQINSSWDEVDVRRALEGKHERLHGVIFNLIFTNNTVFIIYD